VESNQLILIAQRSSVATATLAYHLARAGYNVTTASAGREVLKLVRAKAHDLIVLDPRLPDLSGYALLEELRRDEQTRELGVILLSTDPAGLDGIRGLSLGADDCLTAPASPEEFVLRVGAVLRRRQASGCVDRAAHRVLVDGEDVSVTVIQFRLLSTLIESKGGVCSRQQLLERVWQAKGTVQTRTVDMHLQRLRRKLGSAGAGIETVRGAGYRLHFNGQIKSRER
jgi:two-component system phosphate regulon response regulator PhoB